MNKKQKAILTIAIGMLLIASSRLYKLNTETHYATYTQTFYTIPKTEGQGFYNLTEDK